MKDHRVPPHGYGDGVIPKGQAVGADKQTFRVREEPDRAHAQKIDEVTEVGKEVMVASFVVCVVSNRHEIEQLEGVPPVKELWITANQVSTDQDVENSAYEGELLSHRHSLGVVPSSPDFVDALLHSFSISVKLLVCGRYTLPPFLYNLILGVGTFRFDGIALSPYFLGLCRQVSL